MSISIIFFSSLLRSFLSLNHLLQNVLPSLEFFCQSFFYVLNHHNLCSLKNSSIFFTSVISRIVSLLKLSLSVLPHIMQSILISVVCNFLSSSSKAQWPDFCIIVTYGSSYTTFIHDSSQLQ